MSQIENGEGRDSQFRGSSSFTDRLRQGAKASVEMVRKELFNVRHRSVIERTAKLLGLNTNDIAPHAIFLDGSEDKQNKENIARFRKENPDPDNLVAQFSSLSRKDRDTLTQLFQNPQGIRCQSVGYHAELGSASQRETRSRSASWRTGMTKTQVQAEKPIADNFLYSWIKRLTHPVIKKTAPAIIAAGLTIAGVQAAHGNSSFPSDIAALTESQTDLQNNPQNIPQEGTAFVKDANGQVTGIFTIDRTSNYLYKTQTDSNGNFTQEVQTSNDPIPIPISVYGGSFAVYALDMNTGLVGGGDNNFNPLLYAFFDGGKTFKDITNLIPSTGPVNSILSIEGTNKCIVNLGNTKGGTSQYVLTIDEATQTVTSQAVTFKDQNGNTVQMGAVGFSPISVENANTTVQMLGGYNNGTASSAMGYTLSSLNYETGIAQIDHVTQATIDGVLTNLGYLSGYENATYTDSNGHLHIRAANNDRNLIYDVDTVTLTGTQFNYAQYWPSNGFGVVNNVEVFQSTPGGPIQTWLGGAGGMESLVANVETGKRYILVQGNTGTDDMENINIAGQNLMYVDSAGMGNTVFTLNPDGSPDPNVSFYYIDKDLGYVVVVTPTPTLAPTPTLTPEPTPALTPANKTRIPESANYYIFIPIVVKNVQTGW